MSTTQAQETFTVHVATKNVIHEGQKFQKGDQIPVGPDAPDLPVKEVEVPAEDVAFAWHGVDWEWTPPTPEDAGLPEELESTLETARALLNADPEADGAVQQVEDRISKMQDDLRERRSELRPYVEAVNQARSRKKEALSDLRETRVQKKLGEADEEDVQEAEERFQEATAEVEQAARALEQHESTAEAEIAALESALERLKNQRERKISLAQMQIVTDTADTAHTLFSDVLNNLRNAFQALQALQTLNAAQQERSRMGWAAKGDARLPVQRYTVNLLSLNVVTQEERRLKKTFRNNDVQLKPGL